MSRTALMGIIAIQQALKDAKIEIADILKEERKWLSFAHKRLSLERPLEAWI